MIYDPKTNLVEFDVWQNHETCKLTIRADLIEGVRECWSSEKNAGATSIIFFNGLPNPIYLTETYSAIKKLMETVFKKG